MLGETTFLLACAAFPVYGQKTRIRQTAHTQPKKTPKNIQNNDETVTNISPTQLMEIADANHKNQNKMMPKRHPQKQSQNMKKNKAGSQQNEARSNGI